MCGAQAKRKFARPPTTFSYPWAQVETRQNRSRITIFALRISDLEIDNIAKKGTRRTERGNAKEMQARHHNLCLRHRNKGPNGENIFHA